MKKYFFFIFILSTTLCSYGENTANLSHYFQGTSSCFILFNVNEQKMTTEYNSPNCAERMPPNSTFKIPLSVMAFDRNLITQQTIFKWDRKNKGRPEWNRDQTPKTWITDTVVWVSQALTPQLGLPVIQNYLAKFNYGNQDFSGDAGQNNGLSRAWIGSSLKISAIEQLNFLNNFVLNKLPVSQQAITHTRENMYVTTTKQGWKLYGKTGTSYQNPADRKAYNYHRALQIGWYVGFIQKDDQTYIFVTNLSDTQRPKSTDSAGARAKNITMQILSAAGY